MNLNQITIPSKNVTESVKFYKSLGLKLIVDVPSHYARFELPKGDATFSIHYVETLPQGEGVIVYFEVDDIEKTVNELKAIGIEFETEVTKQPWLWTEARLKDPDGNQLIIYNAGENRKSPPWRKEEI